MKPKPLDNQKGNSRITRILYVLSGVLFVSQILFLGLIVLRGIGTLWTGRGNHWGYDIRQLYGLALGSVLVAVLWLWRERRVAFVWIGTVAAAILLATTIFCFDHFNVLVEYNLWLGRGMP